MAFQTIRHQAPPAESPEAHYRDLPRGPGAVSGLWVHQGDLLRVYARDHLDTPDLALELPTGTGKTLPGLVLLDWVRRMRRVRVVYACPTVQLTRQVAAVAAREGVPCALLTGSNQFWNPSDRRSYEAAEAVAIVTYSTIFNSSPKLEVADVLLFDDSHAGEQYVSEQYSITIRRQEEPETYVDLLEVVKPALNGMFVKRLQDDFPDPAVHEEVQLVFPLRQRKMLDKLDTVLVQLGTPQSFRYTMVRPVLESCQALCSYNSIVIRPFLPPTSRNRLFREARQRLYLSATLGGGGELERAFGRQGINRLAFPEDSPTPRSGRRFFIFPDLANGPPDRLTDAIVEAAGKALCLTPTNEQARQYATRLAKPDWPVFTVDDVQDGMKPFADERHAVCGLANRYDGLDLPGDDCRCVVLVGTPDQNNLQERYLSSKIRANTALAERVRTRIVQGAGRCTRGPDDWALVVVSGSELTNYLMRPETLDALEPELQAEVRFGIESSRDVSHADVLENVTTFLNQEPAWRTDAEPHLQLMRNDAERIPPPGTELLADTADKEVEACSLAAGGQWAEASMVAQDVANNLGAGGNHTRGYRAFWLYLSGLWLDQAGEEADSSTQRKAARSLLEQAADAAKPGTWIRDLAPLPGLRREELSPADSIAVKKVASVVRKGVNSNKHRVAGEEMLQGLSSTDKSLYEPALTKLGLLLGADAFKPSNTGRCDSAWCFDNQMWFAIEAKSEQQPGGSVSHDHIRQVNGQLRLLAADRAQSSPPDSSVAIIISPRSTVHTDGETVAEPEVHLVDPSTVRQLATDARNAWERLLASSAGLTGAATREHVEDIWTSYGLLPSRVRDRLSQRPVAQGMAS